MENQGIKKEREGTSASLSFFDGLAYDIFYFPPYQLNSVFIIIIFILDFPGMPCFTRFSVVMVKCSEITNCEKSGQN